MKQSKSSNDDLKMVIIIVWFTSYNMLPLCIQQLQRSECDRERASVAEQRRKEELGKLKSSVCDGRLVSVAGLCVFSCHRVLCVGSS